LLLPVDSNLKKQSIVKQDSLQPNSPAPPPSLSSASKEKHVDLEQIIESLACELQQNRISSFSDSDEDLLVPCIPVFFDNSKYTYFTKRAAIDCVESGTIVHKKVEDIRPGDELIFVNDPNDHLLKELIKFYSIRDSQFKTQYDSQFNLSQIWKHELCKYTDKYSLTVEELQRRLEKNACFRTHSTINGWLHNSKIIGPMGNGIEAIAVVTGSKLFLENSSQIKKACTAIRRIHRRLRDKIYQNVVLSIMNNSGGKSLIEKDFQEMGIELSKFAEIVCVSKIYPKVIKVPMNLTNRLIEL